MPPAAPQVIEQAAADERWPLPESLAVAVTVSEARDDLLNGMPGPVLVGQRDQRACAILPADRLRWHCDRLRQLLGPRRAALGPTVPLRHAATSWSRAAALLDLTETGVFGTEPLTQTTVHEINLLLSTPRDLAVEFARTTLAPLHHLPDPARERMTETLAAWLALPDKPQAISGQLHVHVQTVRYRLRQLRQMFGDTLDDPRGRFDLAAALRIQRLLGAGPDGPS